MDFESFFEKATGFKPYPHQINLSECLEDVDLIKAATGTGKTEAIILAWLWCRRFHPDADVRSAAPRRLVYCLPMRSLVEQTRERIKGWLTEVDLANEVLLDAIMGGEVSRVGAEGVEKDWRLNPQRDAILVGTQDMLLSRALNRGYGMNRFFWPMEFGLLNNDCLWVMDEVQLMNNGLPTAAQLAAFRQNIGGYGRSQTVFMSATIEADWLWTVDFPAPPDNRVMRVAPNALGNEELERRNKANKALHKLNLDGRASSGAFYNYRELAAKTVELHQSGALTLVVVNVVERAQKVFQELQRKKPNAELLLIHSRFRPKEREAKNGKLKEDLPPEGRIVVATQAVEAGVDISARTLITELAPWSSLVQRFGRCNREGKFEDANIYWLDVPDKDAPPYTADDLIKSRGRLEGLEGSSVAPTDLREEVDEISHEVVLRKRDFIGLFDTTPELSGNFLDVSRFVRGSDERDVQVFWRRWQGEDPPDDISAPVRGELCSAPIGQLKDLLGNRFAWRWDFLSRRWEGVRADQTYPGQTLLLKSEYGGYTPSTGWDTTFKDAVELVQTQEDAKPEEAYDDDTTSTKQKRWIPLSRHSLDVREEARYILEGLGDIGIDDESRQAVLVAAQRHDWGKAHDVFQSTMLSNLESDELEQRKGEIWAKRGEGPRAARHKRDHFRHEVASALALLNSEVGLDGWAKDLAAYLAAAHHGKVRLGIRSLPLGRDQNPNFNYLLGFRMSDGGDDWKEQNKLPPADLGGIETEEMVIDLSISEIGISEDGERSWLDRMLELRDMPEMGLFRMAFLEALVRAADIRASIKEEQGNGNDDC